MHTHGQGRFVWFDLMATDVAAATAFLAATAGWTAQTRSGGEAGGSYTTLAIGDHALGGVLPIPPDAPSHPHWIAHLTTPDVDALCRRVAFVQGEVLMEPTVMAGVGATALVADPGGAVVSPFQFDQGAPAPSAPEPGTIGFATLLAERPDLAARIYRTWFDLQVVDTVAHEQGAWTVFAQDGQRLAAAATPDADGIDPQWVPHVRVDDVDAAVARALEAGGTVVRAATALPEVGRVAIVAAPDGTTLGFIQP